MSGPEADDAPLRALVIDDEPPARRRLTRLLEATGRARVVAEARSVDDALAATKPDGIDVVFLDVQMPGENGFAYVERLAVDVPVVFITAYSDFAVRAFEVDAVDYLLKPVEADRLEVALDRVDKARRSAVGEESRAGTIQLQRRRGARFIKTDAVICIIARGDYTEVELDDGSSELVAIAMREWVGKLPAGEFTRLHRSAIAPANRIERIERTGDRWHAYLHGRAEPVPVSRNVARTLRGLGRD